MTAFLDSNVVVYAFTAEDRHSRIAQGLMQHDFEISVQVLNEFVNVSRRKLKRNWIDIEASLKDIGDAAEAIHPLSAETTQTGVFLAQRYGLAVYDSMIAAAALIARCTLLYSEDMHNGLVIEDRLTIRNPFA